jgi:pilus assembly protein CpaE
MIANDSRLLRGEVRVHLTGEAGALPALREALAGHTGIATVGLTTRLDELAELNGSVDVILHAARDGADLDAELALLRERSQAPIALAVDADSALAERALGAAVAEVLLMPSSPEAVVFAIRRAANAAPVSASAQSHGRIIGICSAKGGSGKSVVACNLAVMLARSGQRTLLLDLDLRFGDAAIMLGLRPEKTIADLAASPGDLDLDKLGGYTVEHSSGLRLLAAPTRPEQGDQVDDPRLHRLLDVARAGYDSVVVDTGGAFDPATLVAVEHADDLFFVVGRDLPCLKDSVAALRTFELIGIPVTKAGFIANRRGIGSGLKRDELATVLDRKPRFELPDDGGVLAAINSGQPVVLAHPRGRFSRAVKELADALVSAPSSAARAS